MQCGPISFDAKSLILALSMLFAMATAVGRETGQDEVVAAVPENFPPYYLLDEDGRPTGYAIETMAHLADMAGLRVRYQVKPDWDSTMEALRQGEVDLIPNLGITPERSNDFDFTVPVETFALGLFVRSVNTDIHGMDDLEGKTVAVVKRNAAVKWLRNFPRVESRLFDHQEQALFALLSGEVDALIYPITVTWKMASEIGVDEQIRQSGLPLLEIKRAVAVRKGNKELLERLDHAVRNYTGSEHFRESYARLHATPTMFWTVERVLRYGAVIVAILLVIIVLALLWWRHLSIVKLEQRLQQSLNALDQSKTEIEELKGQLEKASLQGSDTAAGATDKDRESGGV